MELASVTKMPPQRLMLIVGGGIAAGLLWRKFSGKSSAKGSPLADDAADGSLSYPGDINDLPMDTRGNTGYFPLPAAPSNGTTVDPDTGMTQEEALKIGLDYITSEPGTAYNPADDVAWWQELSPEQVQLAKEQGISPTHNVQTFWQENYGRSL
jgi:hypothetical protein